MEPQAQMPSPESGNVNNQERLPKPLIPEVDKSLEEAQSGGERQEIPSGDSANQNAGAPVAPTVQPVVTGGAGADTPQAPSINVGQTPPVAGDDDLIEKEWVKKAKEVVDATSDNPKIQSDAMGEIKVDYRKKRFGAEAPSQDETTEG